MAASPYTLEIPAGAENDGGRIGQFVANVRDVKWVSNGSNLTADATIAPDDVGMTSLVGAVFLGDAGDDYSGTDVVGTLDVARSSGDLTLSGLSAAGVALDLDSTDIAVARVLFLGA